MSFHHQHQISIAVRELRKRFGTTLALDGMSFSVHPGQVTGFVGPNGAGKSTTMRVILGLDAPDSGTALIGGQVYRSLRRPLSRVGALLDAGALQPSRSGRNHLLWLARSQGLPARRVDEVTDLVGLGSAIRRKAGGYSLGMRQRLGIAAALLGDPPVLILDEPFNGMDPEGIVWMRGFLGSLAAEGRAVLVSSHLMGELEGTADHLVIVGRGRVIAAGLTGAVSASSPRWLRLTRSGDTIRGYDSADGTHWTLAGTAVLTGLPSTVPAGLFVASPDHAVITSQSLGSGSGSGGPSQATATFDRVALRGAWPARAWTGTAVGGPASSPYPVLGYRQADGVFAVTGSGDIAPVPPSGAGSVANTVIGAFAGLIAIVIVAAMFITAEYRRGLIRVILTASPRRSRVLAAKAIVIGVAAFVVGLPAAVASVLIQEPLARSRGIFIDPTHWPRGLASRCYAAGRR